LYYEYVRILNEIKPKYFILENVASMPKEAKQTITEKLFGIEPVMINASLVSAQNRKRLFWVGKWNGKKYEQVIIPQPEDRGILLKDILESNVDEKFYVTLSNKYDKTKLEKGSVGYNPYSGTLLHNKARALNTGCGSATTKNATTIRVGSIGQGGQGDRIYSPEGKSVNLSANGGGRGAKTGLYLVKAAAQRGRYLINGKRKDIIGAKTQQRIEIGGDKAHTLTKVQKDSMVLQNEQVRKLTPIECERLQSMPDNWTNPTGDISNTQRYKMCGNAFNVEVVAHIIKHLLI
jgi:DNA (cytosine-5)-methyltransferase 3A